MRTALDFSPLHRSTIGFDRFFDLLDRASRLDVAASWPPYDIERIDETAYRIRMAVAGFGTDDVAVVQHGNTLTITGRKDAAPAGTLLHQGIAFRDFKQSFGLADFVTASTADLQDGILTIDLRRDVPEAAKPRQIAIGATGGTAGGTAGLPRSGPRPVEAGRKAA